MKFGKRNIDKLLRIKEILLFIPFLVWTLIFYVVFASGGLSTEGLIILIIFALYFVGGPFIGIITAHYTIKKHKKDDKEELEIDKLTLLSIFIGLLVVLLAFSREDIEFGGGPIGLFLATILAISGTFGTYSIIRRIISGAIKVMKHTLKAR